MFGRPLSRLLCSSRRVLSDMNAACSKSRPKASRRCSAFCTDPQRPAMHLEGNDPASLSASLALALLAMNVYMARTLSLHSVVAFATVP